MALELHYHPLSSYCQKVLTALYENGTPFEPHLVDLGNPAVRTAFLQLSPFGKMPALRDRARGETVTEACIIIEYLEQHHPGPRPLLPADPEQSRRTRALDRFFDLYVLDQVAKIVTDKLRPDGAHDPHGVAHARGVLETAYDQLERELATRTWAAGDTFSMADCAAAPALFYAAKVQPMGERRHLRAYHGRLMERPSFARATAEAQPYFHMFPG